MFYYNSPVGTFWIKPRPDGRFALEINNDILGFYHSPVAAADDVYVHVTGYYPWDSLDGTVDGPTDIHEWNRR